METNVIAAAYKGLLTISSTIALLMLGFVTPFLYQPANFESAYAQTAQNQSTIASLDNNTVSYSYNIYSNNNTQMQLNGSSVNYHDNASGYLVYPTNTQGKLPAVIMIHEWWGLNENIKHQADILAREGYVVLAVDLYHGEVTTDSNRAMEFSSSVRNNSGEAIGNLQSAVRYVKSLEIVNGSRIASLGWCFGGDWSLQLALNSNENPLAATILYYGRPVTDADSLSKIRWPVLGIFGDKDQSIPVESVKQFASALNASSIANEIYLYKGVGHAFANPSGDNYAPKETVDAWQKTLAFLNRYV
jgi:carboxymethylenebutenolidase